MNVLLVLTLFSPLLADGMCPRFGTAPAGHPLVPGFERPEPQALDRFTAAVEALDWDAVRADLKVLFKESKDYWPADYGNYAPLFVRLAWHCSGSYRTSDGRGGCDGGRQRFDPERSWEDNTNLDKARSLLWPIKQKYGLGLSWGDLIILAGNTAVQSMGGPILGFCGGRIDATDGSESVELGPTEEQARDFPCPVNGKCEKPLGSTTVGLIYLNPEGPMGQPIPEQSAPQVRDTFGRMAMNDSETVALIGGGHAFGKTHGACPAGPGPSPKEDPANPWPGKCGSGKGTDAFTSGFEGPWTTNPTSWDNEYFQLLTSNTWVKHMGPGGKWQWKVNGTQPVAPGPQGGKQPTMMMTTDVSLTKDPTNQYQRLVKQFAEDQAAFDHAWMHAWYKLTTRDMGPVTRCLGNDVPPAQAFQYPLPSPPKNLANFTEVRAVLSELLQAHKASDTEHHNSDRALFVHLASQCASTFRVTDYLGGCNGARIRFSPEKDWGVNKGLQPVLRSLEPVKTKFGDGLTWADLIVLAGNVAIELAGGDAMPFCPGRSDALAGDGSAYLEPTVDGEFDNTLDQLKLAVYKSGLTTREFVVLSGQPRSPEIMDARGFHGSWDVDGAAFSNSYFTTLLSETWEEYTLKNGKKQFKARGKDLYMLKPDLLLTYDPEFLAIVQDYASDNELFKKEFASAWTRLVTLDRFNGPAGNVCAVTARSAAE